MNIYGPLDPEIADLVLLMRKDGLPTSGSCQGGDGHMFENPYVAFVFPPNKYEVAKDILNRWLIQHGFSDFDISPICRGSGVIRVDLTKLELLKFNTLLEEQYEWVSFK